MQMPPRRRSSNRSLQLVAFALLVAVGTAGLPAAPTGATSLDMVPVLVKDLRPTIDPGIDSSSSPTSFVDHQGTLFFKAYTDEDQYQLWRSDGTEAGTVVLTDLPMYYGQGVIGDIASIGDFVVFVAEDGVHGLELWRRYIHPTSGEVIELLVDINPTAASIPGDLVPFGEYLYFSADDGTNGRELWRTDGTPEGTQIFADINDFGPGHSSYPDHLTVAGDTLFFVAYDLFSKNELWKTDGTEAGTGLVLDINPADGSNPTELAAVGADLYFSAATPGAGYELWRSDGTPVGTMMVRDINPGVSSSLPTDLTAVDGHLFFVADDGSGGRELGYSNGSENGTLSRDLYDGPTGSFPQHLTAWGDRLYFSRVHQEWGRELATASCSVDCDSDDWLYTPQISVATSDFNPGPDGSNPVGFTAFEESLYFAVDDGIHGVEPWRIYFDPSEKRELVADLNPYSWIFSGEPMGSSATGWTAAGGELFFAADNGDVGRELFKLGIPVDEQGPTVFSIEFDPLQPAAGNDVMITVWLNDFTNGVGTVAGADFSWNGGPWLPLDAGDGAFDEGSESAVTTISAIPGGAHRFCARGTDDSANIGEMFCRAITVPATVTDRQSGANRYATAAAVSAAVFPPGVPAVFVATGANFPDALAGGPVGGVHGGPMLLVTLTSIPAETQAELTRLDPATIYILGGEGVVGPGVATALGTYAPAVVRLSGPNRYATAAAVSEALFPGGATEVFVATGANFPDALAGGPVGGINGGPMLLVTQTYVPAETAAELARLGPDTIYVLGGEGVVGPDVATALGAYAPAVVRLFGPNRYATAAAVSEHFFPGGADVVYVAVGDNFPDALAGGPVGAVMNGPILLVTKDSIPADTATELTRLGPLSIVILGGSGVVSEAVAAQLAAYLP